MRPLLLSLCLFFCSLTYSQQRVMDSIDNVLKKPIPDTTRINLINQKIRLLAQVNLDSAIALAASNLQHAIRIHYLNGEAYARVRSATNLCYKGNYTEAAHHLELAEKIFIDLKDSSGKRAVYGTYGILYGMQSQYEKSIDYFQQAATLAEAMKDYKNATSIYQNIATSYQMKSDYTNALSNYQKALSLSEKIGDSATQSYAYINMGMTYYAVKDTNRAKNSYLKAIEIARALGIKNVELYGLSNIVNVYEAEKDYQSALEAARKANKLAIEMGDIGMEATTLAKAANQLALLNHFEEAETTIREALKIGDASKQPINIYQVNNTAGIIARLQKKNTAAISYFEKGLSQLDSSDIYDEQYGNSYAYLSQSYEESGNYQKALAAFKKAKAINDSIISKENVRKATESYMNYDFDKKQQLANAEQQKKDAIAQTKQRALVIGLLLAFLTAAVAVYAFVDKRKANTKLQFQKVKIEETLSELKSTQDQLIQSEKMASLGELTAGIAHEIQNPLNFVNNFSEINRELIQELKEEIEQQHFDEVKIIADNIDENEFKINHHGKRADSIVKSMLQHSRSSTGAKELVDINALCDEYLRLSYHGLRAKDKSFTAQYKTDFDASLDKISVVPQDMGRVILNLLNNAFYAVYDKKKSASGDYEPTVIITTKKSAGKTEIQIKDNGNGIPQHVLDKIFQPFFTTKPTGQGTGLGLSLSYDIIKAHGGEIKADSRENEGTTFTVVLPSSPATIV